MRPWAPLLVIGVLFVTLCALFSNATPYRTPGVLLHQRGPDGGFARVPDVGAPDERQHANYIAHVMAGKGLPVFDPKSPDLFETYQSHQPPLYYVLAAGWCKALGADPQAVPDFAKVRSLNIVIGLATVLGLFFGGLWGIGRRDVGFAAAAVSLMPMNIGLHGAVSNDPLLIALCTWVLAVIAKALVEGWTLRLALIAGVLTGLACLTKTTAVTLLPILALAFVLGRKEGKGVDWKVASAAGCAALVLAVPWWMRNASLYGDPLALNAFKDAFVGSPQASVFIDGLGPLAYWTQWVAWWTARSAIGVFGYMDIFLLDSIGMEKSGAVYVALWIILALPLLFGFERKSGSSAGRGLWVVWGSFFVLVALAFVRFNMQYFQGQARYLYPALGPFAWLFAKGATFLMKGASTWSWAVLSTVLTLLDVVFLNELAVGFARRLV